MAVAYMLFGMAIGVVIGKQYYKHQIVDKKNQKIPALTIEFPRLSLYNKNGWVVIFR